MLLNRRLRKYKNLSYERISRLPLWVILVIPFITLFIITVGTINYLNYYHSHAIIDYLAGELLDEVNKNIETQLMSFVNIPAQINQDNANFIRNQLNGIPDGDALSQYFWQEIQLYPRISSMYFGNTDGGLVVGGREANSDSLYMMFSDNSQSGALRKYATDDNGNLTDLLATVPEYDARQRPWYTGALEKNGVNWTAPYVLSTGQDLAIASSLPVYNADGELLGVASVDLFFSHIGEVLKEQRIGNTGQVYVVEHSGRLIATSSDTPIAKKNGDAWERINALVSENSTIATTAMHIVDTYDGFPNLSRPLELQVEIDGEEHFLWISTLRDGNGLDWVIVTDVPASDFFGRILTLNRVTFILTIVAASTAVVFGILLTRRITRPISELSDAAIQYAQGDWSNKVPNKGVKEVRILGQSFNLMTVQLEELFRSLEDRVRRRTADLARSEARFRAIIEDQTDLILRYTKDFKRTFVNDAYCHFYNMSSEELLGKDFTTYIHPDDFEAYKQKLAQLSQENPVIRSEHRGIRHDGEFRWMDWTLRAIYDEKEQFVEYQAVGRDVTENKRQKEALERALLRETELNEMRAHFISTVSHEFRTPMAIIRNSTQILHRYNKQLSEDQKIVHFDRIQTQIENMTHMLDDVLLIHQTTTQVLEFKPKKLDLVALCQSVIHDIQITTTDIAFDLDCSDGCRLVIADEKLMRLIITNLVSNAAKYSPAGSAVEVSVNCDMEMIRLVVKDSGIGIPKETLPHIFEPFFRAHNSETIEGTGLGLAIVKQCVDHHWGRISVESTVGRGTTFTVVLPNTNPVH